MGLSESDHKSIVQKFSNAIQAVLSERGGSDHLEIEWRIGKFQNVQGKKVFVPHINQQLFNMIKKKLESGCRGSQGMKKNLTCVEDCFGKSSRTTLDLISQEKTTIVKRRLVNVDIELPNNVFDIRMSISEEIPQDTHVTPDRTTFTRRQDRVSIGYRFWRFDLTEVSSNEDSTDKDDDDVTTYEVEIELADMKEALGTKPITYISEAGFLLCLDVMNFVSTRES